jgi:dTDP-4-dehydrorhamnose 3,5-epimerase
MIFESLPFEGALLVRPDRHIDERGYFARTYCRDTFIRHGLKDCSLQCSTSFNVRRGTLRGLHLQREPDGETKLIRCVRGEVYDVIADVREGSPSYGRWHAEHLSAENGLSLYVPAGFVHGFITLVDETELLYQMANPFVPKSAAGIVWDDRDLAIKWPIPPVVISEKDRSLPALTTWRDAGQAGISEISGAA